jgi:hypothetical protein
MPRRPSPLTPDYVWDSKAGRYASAETGRYVSRATIKAELEKVVDRSSENIRALSQALKDGAISIPEWQTGMMREVKTLHVAQTAAANGGWAQMSQSDWGHTGSLVKKQYAYLENFAQQIQSGEQPLNGRFVVRAEMYGDAGRSSYEDARRRYQENDNLMEEERRVLAPAENCPDCIEYAGLGWQPIGALPRIGDSQCRVNCQCVFEYRRRGPDGEYVYSED